MMKISYEIKLRKAQPLWRMDVRHRLGLEPGRNDPISRLLMSALYAAEDETDFANTLDLLKDELQQAINSTKAGAK